MLRLFVSLIVVGVHCLAASEPLHGRDAQAEKRELLFRRFQSIAERTWSDLGLLSPPTGATNYTSSELRQWTRELFDEIYIDSSFGLYWDEIPPPTIRGPEATKGVDRFVAQHGWNSGSNLLAVCDIGLQKAPITGLPWAAIQDRQFEATTLDGVLVVKFHNESWLPDFRLCGVAYNPMTNRMPPHVTAKHLGDHWYVWRLGGEPTIYEGQEHTGQPGSPAKGSQPMRSETNSTAPAAGSLR